MMAGVRGVGAVCVGRVAGRPGDHTRGPDPAPLPAQLAPAVATEPHRPLIVG